jgi:hypothetical protein
MNSATVRQLKAAPKRAACPKSRRAHKALYIDVHGRAA